jgi:D-aminopeptidase
MMVVITDAPLDTRNLKRLAKRCMLGLARTGGIASNGSGDYVIALSTAKANTVAYSPDSLVGTSYSIHNDYMSPFFLAAIEATEEAVWNALIAAESMTGYKGVRVEALPQDIVLKSIQGE